jgi:hypothetical protein
MVEQPKCLKLILLLLKLLGQKLRGRRDIEKAGGGNVDAPLILLLIPLGSPAYIGDWRLLVLA